MRTNRLLIVCAMCVLGLLTPTAVRADGIDSFTWSWPYVGATVTWQLPASPNIPPGDVDTGDGVFSIQAPFTLNGAPAGSPTFDFLDSGYWGGGLVAWDSYGSPIVWPSYGALLYSGTMAAPTFVPGTYDLWVYDPSWPRATLTISRIPEPSTLLLVGIGMLALLGFARKKIAA